MKTAPPRSPSAHGPLIRAPAWVILFLILIPLVAGAADIPPLQARVTDLTNTLNAQQQMEWRRAMMPVYNQMETRIGKDIVRAIGREVKR